MQMNKDTIAFIVHTEFQLMFALNIIRSKYYTNESRVIVVRANPYSANRLNRDFDFSGTDIEYIEIRYSVKRFKDKKLKDDLDDLIELNINKLYVFHENNVVVGYLIRKLYKKAEIILGPDGNNAYFQNFCNDESFSLSARMKQWIGDNLYYLSNGLIIYRPIPRKWYAHRKEIGSVIVEYPDDYTNKTGKTVISIPPICKNKNSLEFICHVFRYSLSHNIPRNSFLWIDQPLPDEIRNKKFDLLLSLKNRYPNREIFIKPHPTGRPPEDLQMFQKLFPDKILIDNVPMELIIANLNEVTLLSWSSSALLYRNDTCNYYYVNKIFNAGGDFLQYDIMKSFSFIKIPSKIEEIV